MKTLTENPMDGNIYDRTRYVDTDIYENKPEDKNILGGNYPVTNANITLEALQSLDKSADIAELTQRIQAWAVARNLQTSDPKSQLTKVVEEVGEVAAAIARGKKEALKDGIGDVFVTIVILAQCSGLDFAECVEAAYNEIKDRKGRLVDGIFIKEE